MYASIPSVNTLRGFACHYCPTSRELYLKFSPGGGVLHMQKIIYNVGNKYRTNTTYHIFGKGWYLIWLTENCDHEICIVFSSRVITFHDSIFNKEQMCRNDGLSKFIFYIEIHSCFYLLLL